MNKNKILICVFKARVEKVHVEGLARTKDDIIQDAVRDLFLATDFQDVLVKAHKVKKNNICNNKNMQFHWFFF